jgi:polyhydroxybutyrate depolymerase
VDDVGFVNALLDDLEARFKVDQQRIYVTGLSNGASMAFRVGRELSERIAALAPVAGSDWLEESRVSEPVSLLYITGDADPLNPIEGGEFGVGPVEGGVKPAVAEYIARWVDMLGCSREPEIDTGSEGVRREAYRPCEGQEEVVFITVEGMGHVWPGGRGLLPESVVRPDTDKLNATEVIWEFFEAHAKE